MRSCLSLNSEAYLSAPAHLGSVQTRAGAPFPIRKRPVQGTPHFDELGAWPYVFVDRDDELEALAAAVGDPTSVPSVEPSS